MTASWIVPSVGPTVADSFSAIWIGVGGQFDTSLIQCGTEQDSVGGQLSYSAWYELLPRSSRTVMALNISPGDQISASIQLFNPALSTWTINITDITTGQSFQNTVTYFSSQLSAEWIVERPTVNNVISSLANFGTTTITNCTATIGNISGGISGFPANRVIMYSSTSPGSNSNPLTDVSELSSDGSSFTVNFLASR